MRERLALVHDYLTQRGGAERVVAAWASEWPNAPLYTSLLDRNETFDAFSTRPIHTSWLNRAAIFRHHHRLALPLLAPTMGNWHIDADVVLASSSGWAHGVRTSGRLVVYCHAPARWLYQHERYLRTGSLGARAHVAARVLGPGLRRWDQKAAQRADTYVVNSMLTRDLVREIYGIDAHVVAPPVTLAMNNEEVSDQCDVLIVSRLLAYKNVDVVIATAADMPATRFRVVGDGPLASALRHGAPSNVRFLGVLGDEELAREYRSARVHLALSHEDFGITPLEAALAGRPTVARRYGGYLDTITEDTGILIDDHDVTPTTVRAALNAALSRTWDEQHLCEHAGRFSVSEHVSKLRAIIDGDSAPQ